MAGLQEELVLVAAAVSGVQVFCGKLWRIVGLVWSYCCCGGRCGV